MSWETGTFLFGLGLAVFIWVAQMMGITLHRWPLRCLLVLSVLMMLAWPVNFSLNWARVAFNQTLASKLQVYERNTYQWDHKGDPNVPTLITSETLLRKPTPGTTGEAFLTPMIGNESSSEIIAVGTNFIITIHYPEGTPVAFGPHAIWHALDAAPRNKQRFAALLEQEIIPGPVKWGPNEMIRAKLPIGKYKVDYFIQGKSEKGEPFNVKRSCNIEIYHLP